MQNLSNIIFFTTKVMYLNKFLSNPPNFFWIGPCCYIYICCLDDRNFLVFICRDLVIRIFILYSYYFCIISYLKLLYILICIFFIHIILIYSYICVVFILLFTLYHILIIFLYRIIILCLAGWDEIVLYFLIMHGF